jgi:hypothetical protein
MPPWFWPAIVAWLWAFAIWITWLAATNHRKDQRR